MGLVVAAWPRSAAPAPHPPVSQARRTAAPAVQSRPGRGAPRAGRGRATVGSAWVSRTATAAGIPEPAVRAYGAATLREGRADPACHLGWTTLAGIGWVESQHGTIGGRVLESDGRSDRPVLGPVLDGRGDVARSGGDGRLGSRRGAAAVPAVHVGRAGPRTATGTASPTRRTSTTRRWPRPATCARRAATSRRAPGGWRRACLQPCRRLRARGLRRGVGLRVADRLRLTWLSPGSGGEGPGHRPGVLAGHLDRQLVVLVERLGHRRVWTCSGTRTAMIDSSRTTECSECVLRTSP